MKKNIICIVCPMGCHLTVDTETLEVTGNTCPREKNMVKRSLLHLRE